MSQKRYQKLNELRNIAKISNVSVIGIPKIKLDISIPNSERNILGYTMS